MATKQVYQSEDYVRATVKIMATMPPERAAQVYDFARFLQAQAAPPTPIDEGADDWLNDSEERMQAEDAAWDATYERHRDRFLALREAARAEIEAGTTQPMFDENGDLAL